MMQLPGLRRYTRLETKLELVPVTQVGKKKKAGYRTWMRFDSLGVSEKMELDRNALVRMAGLSARDLRILGPIFAQSSCILARERAMVVNLEFIRAIVTAEEVLLLWSSNQQVTKFADELSTQLPKVDSPRVAEAAGDGMPEQLPFEFRVLEIALEVVCSYLDAKVYDLERDAHQAIEALTKSVSTEKLESVRTAKSELTRLTARVQKVKEELEQLLDDDEDMADLYLTRKMVQWQNVGSPEAEIAGNELVARPQTASARFRGSASIITATTVSENSVDELEMLLELYFMQTDRTLNKLARLRGHIHDTENYVNIELDNKRNNLIQLELIVTAASLSIAFCTGVCSAFSINLPVALFSSNDENAFLCVTIGGLVLSFLIFTLVIVYARKKKLIGS